MKDKMILVACSALDYVLIDKILSGIFHLEHVKSTEEILRKTRERLYDLFLLDVHYFRENPELMAVMRDNRKVPVIALSSELEDARASQLQRWGYDACYVKPFRKMPFSLFVEYWVKRRENK